MESVLGGEISNENLGNCQLQLYTGMQKNTGDELIYILSPWMQVKWIFPQVIMIQKPATAHLPIKKGLIIEKFCFKV